MMKRAKFGVATVLALVVGAWASDAGGQVELSGNIALTSDYAFRGISQTLEKAAVQGGLDIAAPAGLYAGVWSSSVNFGEDLAAGPRAQMELDVYGGIAPSVSGFDLDAGLLYYAYPGAESDRNYNFLEVYAGIARTLGMFDLGLSGAYSPEFFAKSGSAMYGSFAASTTLPSLPIGIDASIGMQTIDDNGAFGTPDYAVWSVGVAADVLGASVGGSVTGTDLKEVDCFGGSDLCKARFIVSVSRAL